MLGFLPLEKWGSTEVSRKGQENASSAPAWKSAAQQKCRERVQILAPEQEEGA